MIQNLIFGILFLKILFRACNVCPDVPEDIIRVFLISDLLAECLKANKKPAKKITHFTTKFRLKNLTYFTWHWKQYVTATQLKKVLTLHIFQQRCFCLGSEKIFALHHFVMPVCIFLYISLRKFLFREHSKVLSGRECMGGAWISSLRRLTVSLAKCFTIFHLIEILENSIIF